MMLRTTMAFLWFYDVCDGCVLYNVFDARWTYSTYTWDMWRVKPRSLDWF